MISAVILTAAMVTAPTLGVSAAPAAVISTGNAHAVFTVGNEGNQTEKIVIQVTTTKQAVNNPNLFVPESEYDHYRVSVPEFVLAPKAHKSVTVTITDPGMYAEHLAVVAEAFPMTQGGTARPHAEVAAKWTVTGKPGHAPGSVTLPQLHKSSGVPLVPVVATSLLLGFLAACGRYLQLKRRRRTT